MHDCRRRLFSSENPLARKSRGRNTNNCELAKESKNSRLRMYRNAWLRRMSTRSPAAVGGGAAVSGGRQGRREENPKKIAAAATTTTTAARVSPTATAPATINGNAMRARSVYIDSLAIDL